MAYDIFHSYGFDKIHDSSVDDHDYKETGSWELVKCKSVKDSDGFMTDYCWYTDGSKHIFMFGDSDIYIPDEDYADHVADSESEALEWFDDYEGFVEDDPWYDFEEDSALEDAPTGNADFINEGFYRAYKTGDFLED